MKILIRTSLVLTALLATFLPALGLETAWQEIGPDARVRLIGANTITNGTAMAAIEIEMPDTTKTYWRIPGETGIPLIMDTAQSKGVGKAEILWPYPTREKAGGYLDFVYHGNTVLPVALEVSGPATLTANLLLGVCDEICVPVRTTLSLDMDFKKASLSQSLRIRQAVVEVPVPWDNGPDPIGDVTLDPANSELLVAITPGALDPASIIVDTGDPKVLFDLPQKSPDNGLVRFRLLDSGAFTGLSGTQLTVTFVAGDYAYALQRRVLPSAN